MDLTRLQRALDLFADYDVARLEAYRGRGNPERIAMRDVGRSRVLRFDEVGYFNRVYHVDWTTPQRLPEVLSLYEGSDHSVELVGAAGVELEHMAGPLWAAGFRPGLEYARLELELPVKPAPPPPRSCSVTVRVPELHDREAVLEVYLRGFGVEEGDLAGAKANMKLLFDVPRLHFWLALVEAEPVSIGMLYVSGDLAYLCGGATLPDQERRGGHAALIHHRLAAARELGATHAVSWAHAGSTSHRNMCAMGLTTVATDRAWVRPRRGLAHRAG